MKGTSIALGVTMIVAACGPDERPDRGGNGGPDGGGTGDGAQGATECADGAELVYTIDQFSARLSRFDPSTKTFHDLGSLNCHAMPTATPFSMSVDRQAVAWVLYTSGELFSVPLSTLSCTKMVWSSPHSLKVFGMGFSTDTPGGSTEALYIGGGQSQAQSTYTLARVEPATMATTPIGMHPALPEMTGTGNAELWGFFPEPTTARVVRFDKTTGAIAKTFDLPTLAGTGGYAFAHWGGDFWVFLIKNGEASTKVYQVAGDTGAIVSTTPTTGRTIVGAGVSTCAPTVIL